MCTSGTLLNRPEREAGRSVPSGTEALVRHHSAVLNYGQTQHCLVSRKRSSREADCHSADEESGECSAIGKIRGGQIVTGDVTSVSQCTVPYCAACQGVAVRLVLCLCLWTW